MIEEWLIDGYNVLYDYLSKTQPHGASTREFLFQNLASFAGQEPGRSVIIVLDGVGNNDEFSSYKTKSFDVVYSQAITADAVIEKYIYDHRAQKTMVVVTKDRAVANMTRGLGVRVFTPSEFMIMLKDSQAQGQETIYKYRVKSHGFNRPFEGKL